MFRTALQVVEGPFKDQGQLVREGRLEGGQPVLRHADQWRADRLMSAAFGCEADTRRRAHDDEAGVLIAGVVEGIETALNEGVIERSDRQQTGSEQRVRQSQSRESNEEIVLGGGA